MMFSRSIRPAYRLYTAPRRAMSALASYQKARWESYLASGRGSIELFRSIDANNSGNINPRDIKVFLQAVGSSTAVQPRAFQQLDKLASDHPLTLHEFQDWLIEATKAKDHSTKVEGYEAMAGPRAATAEEPHPKHAAGVFAWNESTMSQSVRRMQYAVRGEIVIKADALQEEGRKIIFTNIGNPQALGQRPITYYRQVLALCDLPAECGVDHPHASDLFPKDVLERAKELRAMIGNAGTGAYTNSQGIQGFRKNVADFISERDGGHPAYPGDIFLTNGASSAIDMVLSTLLSCDRDSILIPIPQYPIYSASIARLAGRQVGYELDEGQGWGVSEEELEKRLAEAHQQGLAVKGMVIINPGNPTGQVMKRKDIEMVCKFCAKHGIVLLADEVYQRNVYDEDSEFVSAKKVCMETPGCEELELISFHSTSKGLIGECGRRGGYMELHGIDPKVHAHIYKLASSGLCSGVAGQIMTSLMVKGPNPGDDSYDLFQKEESAIYESLKRRAKALVKGLNEIDGIDCNPAQGSMYAFPRVTLPPKAHEAAELAGQTPDTLYALSLLEETGICVVPASGFGQTAGRVGFRTTFLPPEDELMFAIGEFKRHHELFCNKYD